MVDKAQEDLSTQEELKERHHLRFDFWNMLLPRLKGQTPIFQNSSPSRDHWLTAGGVGISGVNYTFLITRTYCAVEVDIMKADASENKQLFDELIKFKDEITATFGEELSWERLDNKKMSRVAFYKEGVNIFIKEDWPSMIDFLVNNMIQLEISMREPLKKVKQRLHSGSDS
jgi:hypothetical protein